MTLWHYLWAGDRCWHTPALTLTRSTSLDWCRLDQRDRREYFPSVKPCYRQHTASYFFWEFSQITQHLIFGIKIKPTSIDSSVYLSHRGCYQLLQHQCQGQDQRIHSDRIRRVHLGRLGSSVFLSGQTASNWRRHWTSLLRLQWSDHEDLLISASCLHHWILFLSWSSEWSLSETNQISVTQQVCFKHNLQK